MLNKISLTSKLKYQWSYNRGGFLGVLLLVVGVPLIWYGYGEDRAVITKCTSTVTKWVTAEYSETSVSMDMEGDVSYDTDYWSDPASEVYKVITINGEFISGSHAFEMTYSNNSYYPPMPLIWSDYKKGVDFDNFDRHNKATLRVDTERGNEPDHFDEPITSTEKCNENFHNFITVKTWYGISYGSDF